MPEDKNKENEAQDANLQNGLVAAVHEAIIGVQQLGDDNQDAAAQLPIETPGKKMDRETRRRNLET